MKVPFSQLWIEEEEALSRLAQDVGSKGVIVEIGTAQGGSSYVMSQAVKDRDVEIFSYDIKPCQEAIDNLRGTKVKIKAQASEKGAQSWPSNQPIDLLFIDGSHTLNGVYSDFLNWAPKLKETGVIAFHDYDPPSRGGCVHLGVEVFINALKETNTIKNHCHVGRLFWGQLNSQVLSLEALKQAWREKGNKVRKYLKADNWFQNENIDELTLCYLIQEKLRSDWDGVLKISKDRRKLFKACEGLEMLSHSKRQSTDLTEIFEPQISDARELSQHLAHEHSRLSYLLSVRDALQGNA